MAYIQYKYPYNAYMYTHPWPLTAIRGGYGYRVVEGPYPLDVQPVYALSEWYMPVSLVNPYKNRVLLAVCAYPGGEPPRGGGISGIHPVEGPQPPLTPVVP